jgi:hypothetical protein
LDQALLLSHTGVTAESFRVGEGYEPNRNHANKHVIILRWLARITGSLFFILFAMLFVEDGLPSPFRKASAAWLKKLFKPPC